MSQFESIEWFYVQYSWLQCAITPQWGGVFVIFVKKKEKNLQDENKRVHLYALCAFRYRRRLWGLSCRLNTVVGG